jgi:hypothetical protein
VVLVVSGGAGGAGGFWWCWWCLVVLVVLCWCAYLLQCKHLLTKQLQKKAHLCAPLFGNAQITIHTSSSNFVIDSPESSLQSLTKLSVLYTTRHNIRGEFSSSSNTAYVLPIIF